MLIILVGMVLILLIFTGVSDFSQKEPKDLENRYLHELELRNGPVSKYRLFEKPDEYREIYYMISLLH
jgi:hypothetical protein